MGLVDYEFSSSSDGDETKLKKPSKPPSAMTSNSELNRATTTTQSKKSKKPAKRGERRQLTANFFLPPKMQAALLAGDISSDSDDDNGIDEGQSAKIRVRKDGEKGLLDILPAPSSSGKSKGGGSLGDAAASIIASARIMKMTKESNRCAVDITTTKSKPVEEEEDDEEEEEEEEEEQQEDIIASVKEEIELKSKVKKTNTLMSQSTSSILGDTTTIQKQQQQLYSSPHDDPSVPPKSTITIKQVYNHHDDPITTSWSSSSHSGSVYGTAIEGVQPVVRKNHIPTSSYSAAAQTTQQFVPAAYYNNVGNNECHQPQGTNTSWSNDNNLDSQVGNSRRGNKVSSIFKNVRLFSSLVCVIDDGSILSDDELSLSLSLSQTMKAKPGPHAGKW